ncbi:unnamed protein product [Meganyctiphanes norvegica]|uniref:Uncharacterized protein n=1 Tax=Meganyctiphanes norvegica TaxID=48144 RepID=A0AAV2SLT8_MEGNR
MSDEDHIPVTTHVDLDILPCLSEESNETVFKINWESATEADLKSFLKLTDQRFSNIELPVEALLCSDLNCNILAHRIKIETFYNDIINILIESSKHLCSKVNSSRNRPGWSDYVADIYDYSREARKLWLENGKPRQGFCLMNILKVRQDLNMLLGIYHVMRICYVRKL